MIYLLQLHACEGPSTLKDAAASGAVLQEAATMAARHMAVQHSPVPSSDTLHHNTSPDNRPLKVHGPQTGGAGWWSSFAGCSAELMERPISWMYNCLLVWQDLEASRYREAHGITCLATASTARAAGHAGAAERDPAREALTQIKTCAVPKEEAVEMRVRNRARTNQAGRTCRPACQHETHARRSQHSFRAAAGCHAPAAE